MYTGGDAAEQVVRLSLEGFEVAAKVTGEAAKNIAVLLLSALKQEQKTKGKSRLTKMIRSGKELKVFAVRKKDLKTFVQQAKKYGVLYTVLRDRHDKSDNAVVDIIARAEDASKIQRIMDRFELATVDKGSIVKQSEKAIEKRRGKAEDAGEKNAELFDELFSDEDTPENKNSAHSPAEKDKPKDDDAVFRESAKQNPTSAKAEKSPPSEQNSRAKTLSDAGTAVKNKKPSVRKKLNGYKVAAKKLKRQKEAGKAAQIINKLKPKER